MFSIGVSDVVSRDPSQVVHQGSCLHVSSYHTRVVLLLFFGEILTFCRITNKTLHVISLSIYVDVYPKCCDVVVLLLGALHMQVLIT